MELTDLDHKVFEIWRGLDTLDCESFKRIGVEGKGQLRNHLYFSLALAEQLAYCGPGLVYRKDDLQEFLSFTLENVSQHAIGRLNETPEHFGIGEINRLFNAAVLWGGDEDQLSVYVIDSGKGFVDQQGNVVLADAHDFQKGYGVNSVRKIGLSLALDSTDQYFAFSCGSAVFKESRNDFLEEVNYPFGEIDPPGAMICGRFYRHKSHR